MSEPGYKIPPPLYTEADRQREQETPEKAPYRSDFRRDYARLLHCPSFRRLQGKTQLFPGIESDFFRNRLTHSLEVAQVAKAIALRINLEYDYFKENPIDVDLVETAALAHDLGHPPFGHTGEKALDDCMKDKGGFEGNAQTLRILVRLEKKKRPESDKADGEDPRTGLGLTHRTLAAVLKYDHCIKVQSDTNASLQKGYYQSEKPLVDRGSRIVKEIFEALTKPDGNLLLPDDYRDLLSSYTDDLDRDRAICDFIASMTDRYAVEFYGRLKSESAQTIFKPL